MAAHFLNWSQTVSACPAEWIEPASEAEVLATLRRARAEGRRLKAVGSGHSWSRIAVTDGIMLSLRRLNRVLSLDPAARTITVEAGMRLFELDGHLRRAGLSLSIFGSIAQQHIAGAIATGTHGSSLTHGSLSSLVRGVRLLTPEGEVLDIGEGDERLRGARVHLGALGVLSRVTLQVEPAFLLEEEAGALPFDEAAARLPEIARSAEYVKLWWLPHVPFAQLYRCRRVAPGARPGRLPPLRSFGRWIDEAVVNRYLFSAVLRLAGVAPAAVPALNRAIARAYFRPRRLVGTAREVLTVPMPPRHRETERAVPVERGGVALGRLAALIEGERLRVNFPVEARFVRGDDGWLSPAAGRDSCQLGAYMAPCADLPAYFEGFTRLMRELGGRPHWGKELEIDREEVTRLWPDAERFRALARALDPNGMMRNALLDQVL